MSPPVVDATSTTFPISIDKMVCAELLSSLTRTAFASSVLLSVLTPHAQPVTMGESCQWPTLSIIQVNTWLLGHSSIQPLEDGKHVFLRDQAYFRRAPTLAQPAFCALRRASRHQKKSTGVTSSRRTSTSIPAQNMVQRSEVSLLRILLTRYTIPTAAETSRPFRRG